VNEASRNERVRNGMTSMDSNRFGRDAVTGHGSRGVSEATFRQASMATGRMPSTTSKESFSPSGRAANPSSVRNTPPSSQRFFSGARGNGGTNTQGTRSFGNANTTDHAQSGFNNRNSGSFGRPSPQGQSQSGFQPGNTNHVNGSVQSSRPGWRTFTPPQSSGANRSEQGPNSNNRAMPNNTSRTFAAPSRDFSQGASSGALQGAPAQNRNSWQHFTPPAQQPNGAQHGFQPPTQASRGGSFNSYSRPTLNMRQPVVTPRGGSGGGYSNGSRPSYSAPTPSYSAPHPSYSAPRPSYSAPTPSYSAPRPSYSAPRPSYSAPRPSYSAPRPSYSAPRPSYSAPRPSYSAPRPSYSAPRGGGFSAPRGGGGGGGAGSRGGNGSGHSR
jgi:hypothetical protein